MIELRTHRVARAAYGVVCARLDEPSATAYAALAKRFPGMILQNGIAQATGFLLAKGRAEHLGYLDDLLVVLRAAGITRAEGRAELHREIIEGDFAVTMRLTRQALEASGWLRRYVQGLSGDEPGSSDARGNA